MFRTPIKIVVPNYTISHEDNIFLIGSCFAENIYRRLYALQYQSLLNPFGILYNPLSISKAMNAILSKKRYEINDLFQHNGLWHSYDHHGEFSNPNKEIVLEKINNSITDSHLFLEKSTVLIITLGTANAFELINSKAVVANCHKVPNTQFQRKRLSVNEIVENMIEWISKLSTFGDAKLTSQRKIILTVSPIRHIRDGLVENQRSKATLLLAISELEKQLPNVFYFPSFEILMDDLRDYRFYEKDMIHPNGVAIDYVWKKFGATFFDDKTKELNKKIQQIVNGLGHRLLHPDTEESLKFKNKLKQEMKLLEMQYSFLNFKDE